MSTQSLAGRRSAAELAHLTAIAKALPIEDKVALLTGETMWHLRDIASIGLGRLSFSDGPVGVRGTNDLEPDSSLLFPSPSSLAAAWDVELAREVGRCFAREARAHRVDVVLAPQVNIQRTPVAGRHFECYSEDPLLTASIGAHVVAGVQSQGVGACVKHFIANDAETDRTTAISRVDERTLREVYLAPFEAAIEAGAWSIMAAYNQADDGVETSPMTAHRHLLRDVLKGDLGFDGVVVSDWVATHTTVESARAGLDLVMPGPGGPWEARLLAAVRSGDVSEDTIDDKVARILLLARRVGALDRPAVPVTHDTDIVALIRRAAARGTVVLRNSDPFPVWDRPEPRSIALIGPNAVRPHVLGGGSSTVHPDHVVTPAEGLTQRYPDAHLTVRRGTDPRRLAPSLDLAARQGTIEVRHLGAGGELLATETLETWDGWLRGIPDSTHTVELRFDFLLDEVGEHVIQVGTVGAHRIDVDGALVSSSDAEVGVEVILNSSINNPEGEVATVVVEQPRRVAIRASHRVIEAEGYGRMVRSEVRHRVPAPSPDEELADAVAAADSADMVVVIVGTNEESESEGWDRHTLALPGRQDALVERVLDVAPSAVIVVNAGAPVLLPWLERARTVLWTWFPGQEAGHALADIVAGDVEPSGRLPWTLPDSPDHVGVPHAIPDEGVVTYDEGVHVGYRGWLRSGHTPAAPFGHGLGWTSWGYSALRASRTSDGGALVSLVVANTGERAGTEVVQVYLEAPATAGLDRPVRWLGGFATVHIPPGESSPVTVEISRRQFEVWDAESHTWKYPAGTYHVRVGRSVADIRLDTAVQVDEVTTGRSTT